MPTAETKKRLLVCARVAFSLAVFGYVARDVDFSSLFERLRGMRGELFAAAVAQLLLIPVLGALRWEIVLRCLGYARRLLPLGRVFWIGMALNQVLPTAVGGDVFRTWTIYRDGVGLVDATISVLLERVVLLGTLLLLVAVAGWTGSRFVPPDLFRVVAFTAFLGIVGLTLLPLGGRVIAALPSSRAVRFAGDLLAGFVKVVTNYRVVPLAVLCLLTNLNLVFSAWWLGMSLDMQLGPSVYLVVIPVVTLVTLLPISIGGWGVREAATIGLLGPLAGDERALLHSIAFGVALLISSLPGLLLMIWNPVALRDLRNSSAQGNVGADSDRGKI